MEVLRILIKRNRGWVTLSVATALMSNASQIMYLYYIGELVNRIEKREVIELSFIIIPVCFILTNAITQILNQYVGRYSSEKMAHTLRMGYAGRLVHKAVEEKLTDTAQAMSVVQNELAQAGGYLSGAFFDITGMMITGCQVSVFLMFENVNLTLVILIPTFLILIYVVLSGRKLSEIVNAAQSEKRKMNRTVYSVVHAFPAIKIYDGEELCEKAYEESVTAWTGQAARLGRLAAVYNTLSGVLSRVPLLLLLMTGGYMVVRGKLLMGTLIVFINLEKSLTQSIMNLPNWLSGFKVFTTNLSRIEIE